LNFDTRFITRMNIAPTLPVKFPLIWLLSLWLCLSLSIPAAAGARVDQLGRRVSVPDDPARVISMAPSITEIIYALQEENRLKGATLYSDYPAAAKKLPRIGFYVRLDIERILALNPDLCIATRDGNPKAIVDRLSSLNIPVYVVNPHDLDSILDTILKIGSILNADHKAKILVGDLGRRIQRVKNRAAQSVYRPRVFFQIGISPIVSAGTGTFIHQLIDAAGGTNLAAGSYAYPRFSKEQVLALVPDVIIITSMARQAVFEQVRDEWRRWPDIPAVRDERIYLVDSDLFDRPSPRLVSGLELLIRLIHPELTDQTQ